MSPKEYVLSAPKNMCLCNGLRGYTNSYSKILGSFSKNKIVSPKIVEVSLRPRFIFIELLLSNFF